MRGVVCDGPRLLGAQQDLIRNKLPKTCYSGSKNLKSHLGKPATPIIKRAPVAAIIKTVEFIGAWYIDDGTAPISPTLCKRRAMEPPLNLETAIDRLLPVEIAFLLERYNCFLHHQMGDHATRSIARLLSPLALLLLAWNGHAASSRLASRLSNRTLEHV